MKLASIPVVGKLPVTLPECEETVDVVLSFIPLKIVPLSKAERKRYWNKTVVEHKGEITVAELVIRRIVEGEGVDAVWVTGPNRFTKVWSRKQEILHSV